MPINPIENYLPIEDYGLIGDGTTSALIGRNGSIDWLCLPRFDSPPLFCGILDHRRGGSFTIAPEDLVESRQYYLEDTGVLITELRGQSGLVRITDALTLRSGADLSEDVTSGRRELLRAVEVLQGTVRLRIDVEPRGGGEAEQLGGGLRIKCAERSELDLQLVSTIELEGLHSVLDLEAGERVDILLQWERNPHRHQAVEPGKILEQTTEAWRRWLDCFKYEGPQKALVRRSAVTLKLLDHFENGAIVAAPTSSLPERIGGVRNWDYRFSWVRDAAFSVYALRRIGLESEAAGFLGWVLDAAERNGQPYVLYDLDGERAPEEWEDPDLEGYRGSSPVRWGNGAIAQRQNDVYGEIIDCAYQWASHGGEITEHLWERLRYFIETAGQKWHEPDHGIWEVRTPGRVFTYSAALCQVALDRGARLAESFSLPGDINGWRAKAEKIRQAIIEESWDEDKQSFTEHLGGGGLDASLLSLPIRRLIPADHPRMVATTKAIREHLGAGEGLVYRYNPDMSPDGLEGHEGAFLLCSFWLVDNLAHEGRLDEAMELYDSLCARAGTLGLLPEQIDPGSGQFLGNYPQAFSHVGVIASGVTLARLTGTKTK